MATEIVFNSDQFAVMLTMILFFYFFYMGYTSERRSGGFLMIFSGLTFIYLEFLTVSIFSSVYIIPLMSPFAILFILLGIKKTFYSETGDSE